MESALVQVCTNGIHPFDDEPTNSDNRKNGQKDKNHYAADLKNGVRVFTYHSSPPQILIYIRHV
jgi:hypothetical protein